MYTILRIHVYVHVVRVGVWMSLIVTRPKWTLEPVGGGRIFKCACLCDVA